MFREDPSGYIAISELNFMLENQFVGEENRAPKSEVGKQVKLAFPMVEKVRMRIEGKEKREWIYKGISLKLPQTKVGKSHMDTFWYSIPEKYSRFKTWCLMNRERNEESYSWFSATNISYENATIFKEVTYFRNSSYKFVIGSYPVPTNLIPVGDVFNEPCVALESLLTFSDSTCLCLGFEVDCETKTYDCKGEVIGMARTYSYVDENGLLIEKKFHRSLKCNAILSVTCKNQRMCVECASIKHNSYYKTLNGGKKTDLDKETSKFKRETWMTEEEKSSKLKHEKRRRISAESRTKYLKEKVLSEMQCFSEEDNDDLCNIFNQVNEGTLTEDMKLFYKVQKENLGRKSSKGYRWHPK